MRQIWAYLKYLARHKWYVFKECWRERIPLQGLLHDLSKFWPDEFVPYLFYFYGERTHSILGDTYYRVGPWIRRADWVQWHYNEAWLKHQHRNPHHWQHWLLRLDDGGEQPLEMPLRYRKEMLADWIGAGMALGKPNAYQYYWERREITRLAPMTKWWFEGRLRIAARNRGWR